MDMRIWMVVVTVGLQLGSIASSQERARSDDSVEETAVTLHASGTFEVELTAQPFGEGAGLEKLGRMSIDKKFQGDLEGVSKGQMLSAYGNVEDSAGYVAMERVEGVLAGRSGSFILQHSGTMHAGEQKQAITVVPDSGTGELAGIEGRMTIRIDEGQHFYDFEYTLPEGS